MKNAAPVHKSGGYHDNCVPKELWSFSGSRRPYVTKQAPVGHSSIKTTSGSSCALPAIDHHLKNSVIGSAAGFQGRSKRTSGIRCVKKTNLPQSKVVPSKLPVLQRLPSSKDSRQEACSIENKLVQQKAQPFLPGYLRKNSGNESSIKPRKLEPIPCPPSVSHLRCQKGTSFPVLPLSSKPQTSSFTRPPQENSAFLVESRINNTPVKPKHRTVRDREHFLENIAKLEVATGSITKSSVTDQNTLTVSHPIPIAITAEPGDSPTFPPQRKKKGLLGEFTHIPSVCGVFPSQVIRKSAALKTINLSSCFVPGSSKVQQSSIIAEPTVLLHGNTESRFPNLETLQNSSETKIKKNGFPCLAQLVNIVIDVVDGENKEHDVGKEESVDVPVYVNQVPKKEKGLRSIMHDSQTRQEEFLRLLEEYAQIVSDINKVENVGEWREKKKYSP
ncbi:uncharacterized protein LOC143252304 isoform X1 [Tachypleus tridentatus]|uniref:uncharacterized protein LOC143252304 isoform X1 n=1 Tax=Tachypleus tridentatus TaxID=6853 RepID=UPI003FD53B9D